MAERLVTHDWSTTPLGPVEGWSQSLRTAVAILLRSRYPMLLSWGEHLVMLYNDAFIPTLGEKHPRAVGGLLREEFAEVWDEVGPMQESVLAAGPATWFEDLPLVIERGTGPEETFFTFSYSHVPDERGPGGVLAVLAVTTDKVVAARRMALLHELALATAQVSEPLTAVTICLDVMAKAGDDLLGGALYRRTQDSDPHAPALRLAGAFGVGAEAVLPDVLDEGHPAAGAWSRETQVTGDAADVFPAGSSVLLAGPRVQYVGLPVRGPAGVEAVLLLLPNPLRPYDAEHEKFLGLVADRVGQAVATATVRASERARIEALARIDAAKTAFLSSVSHEFRTPLTLLLGPLEDVLSGRTPSVDPAAAEVMYNSAHRLLRMVDALLDVARIEADGFTARAEPTDLPGITRDLLQVFGAAAQRAGLRLETDLEPGLGAVLVDPGLWEKILTNLVANAIKYTPEGSVRVELSRVADELVLRVADTGLGIPPSEIDLVFDRFHRVQQHGARTIEGTGVGLTVVAEAARAMGGSVGVESQPGAGSTFEVRIPHVATGAPVPRDTHLEAARVLANDVAAVDEPEARHPLAPLGLAEAPLILVVEDNRAMGARISSLLSTLGQVRTAPDGLAALDILRAEDVDLVVSDVMMPNLDGLGLLEAIRDDEGLRSTPVVLLSARAGSEAATGGIEAGADDYVVKPFTSEELLARCRTTLELTRYRSDAAAAQARGALLAGVSHDMQTPLAVVTTSLGLLEEPDLDPEQRRHIARRARVRARQLSRLVTQFLDWSRLNTSQPLPARIEAVDLGHVITEVSADHDRVAVLGGFASARVRCDRHRTEQILNNLIDNAERVARTRIEIEIALDSSEDLVAVRVRDDGPGVSTEVLPWLFDAFGPSTAPTGTGLGLHVSREAATAQGGSLVLESTGPEGSVFTLSLPRERAS